MAGKLKGLVLGSGFAGQGHAEALRDAGVEIAGMASRTEAVVRQVAERMGIPYATTDWRKALADLQPDVVAVGTPGGAHFEPLKAALRQGAHVFCDKPMTTSADTAKEVYRLARSKGVKTAFAASFRYQPHASLARRLVSQGAIGDPREVECISHYNLNPLIPWGWSHSIALGGGRLSNNFTHKLSIVEHVLDGRIIRVNGETRNDMRVAPVVEGVHDFRERESLAPGKDGQGEVEWKTVDSEWSYTVMAKVEAGVSVREPVSALFKHGGMLPRKQDDYVAFYGSAGAIFINGSYAQGPLFVRRGREGEWEQAPLPRDLVEDLPDIKDDTQRNWTQLAREFVADIRGQGYSGYQTFRDGWIYQDVVDAVRAASGWHDVPRDA
jgi:predicted dehydrogenase